MKLKFLIFCLIGVFLITSLIAGVSAYEKDVIYIVRDSQNIRAEFINSFDELGLSYNVTFSRDLPKVNLQDFKVLVLNDEYFPNWDEIPVHDHASLLANGRHMHSWGWTKYISDFSSDTLINVSLVPSEITFNLPTSIVVSDEPDAEIYYLREIDKYNGIETVASILNNSENVLVGLARAGTNLTKDGKPDTVFTANSIFFGLADETQWSNDAKQLFKDCLEYLVINVPESPTDYSIDFVEGQNMISFPLEMDATQINGILNNDNIINVLEWDGTRFVEANTLVPGKGYIINSTGDFSLTITGQEPRGTKSLDLNEGMNLIGLESLNTFNVNDLPIEVIELSSRRQVDGKYNTATSYSFGWYNPQLISLEPGKGYWLKLNSDTIWEYQA